MDHFLSDNNLPIIMQKQSSGIYFSFSNQQLVMVLAQQPGLVPFTNVSYDVDNSIQSSNGDYQTTYKGRGGLSRLFFGLLINFLLI